MTALKIKYVHSILTPYNFALCLVHSTHVLQPNLFAKRFGYLLFFHYLDIPVLLKQEQYELLERKIH